MSVKVQTGLERLLNEPSLAERFKGNIGFLCHSASVNSQYEHGLIGLQKIFGKKLIKVFGPQHGFVSDVQDNMVETPHMTHPYFKIPVYSLYSETRIPTDEMLEGLDHIFVDLQDVGCRIYTYIYTLTLLMDACAKKNIEVIVLDRPNPINGLTIEGNILDPKFQSFVGLHPLPVRHALTLGEVGRMHEKNWLKNKLNFSVIEMTGWKRSMSFEQTKLPWVLPSPNLATIEAAYTFVGTVLFEGTNISEGRGTTRSLEIIGHPKIEPFSFLHHLEKVFKEVNLTGFKLRPLAFLPTFQKHAGSACGGFQIHVTDRDTFEPWRLSQYLCREFYHHLKDQFTWKQPPYEYEYHKLPIDLINGTDLLRLWVEKNQEENELRKIEKENLSTYLNQREEILIYRD